tara:strand:- start:199 stop:375 length:177 start_codon:yes stop_codon:yes gene_type:complete
MVIAATVPPLNMPIIRDEPVIKPTGKGAIENNPRLSLARSFMFWEPIQRTNMNKAAVE